MFGVMEGKKNWNLRVFDSIAAEFDKIVDERYRGDKGACCSAAVAMFLLAGKRKQRKMLELIKLAEVRGDSGTILQALREVISEVRVRSRQGAEISDDVLEGLVAEALPDEQDDESSEGKGRGRRNTGGR